MAQCLETGPTACKSMGVLRIFQKQGVGKLPVTVEVCFSAMAEKKICDHPCLNLSGFFRIGTDDGDRPVRGQGFRSAILCIRNTVKEENRDLSGSSRNLPRGLF